MRYKISLSYNGEPFCGWQIQPKDPSVQQCIQEALSKLLGDPIEIVGAGRTDTGVSAKGYVAHFDTDKPFDCDQLCYKMNAILPQSVVIESICRTTPDFHARFGATGREYTYFLHTKKDPFMVSSSFLCTFPLDFEQMNKAACLLLGTHDFSCFEKTGADNKTSICTIKRAEWIKYEPVMSSGCGEYWYFKIEADRFLRNMVRAIVGTLIEVGRGKRSADSIVELLSSKDRCRAGESVPGHALFLTKVSY